MTPGLSGPSTDGGRRTSRHLSERFLCALPSAWSCALPEGVGSSLHLTLVWLSLGCLLYLHPEGLGTEHLCASAVKPRREASEALPGTGSLVPATVPRSLAQCPAAECPLQSSQFFPSRDQVKAHLWEHVQTLMAPFLEGKSGDSLPADFPVKSGMKLGLTVLFMVEEVGLVVLKNDLDTLCYLLTPSAGSPEALHSDLSPILSKPQKYFLFISILCVQVFHMHICLYIVCMPGAY